MAEKQIGHPDLWGIIFAEPVLDEDIGQVILGYCGECGEAFKMSKNEEIYEDEELGFIHSPSSMSSPCWPCDKEEQYEAVRLSVEQNIWTTENEAKVQSLKQQARLKTLIDKRDCQDF